MTVSTVKSAELAFFKPTLSTSSLHVFKSLSHFWIGSMSPSPEDSDSRSLFDHEKNLIEDLESSGDQDKIKICKLCRFLIGEGGVFLAANKYCPAAIDQIKEQVGILLFLADHIRRIKIAGLINLDDPLKSFNQCKKEFESILEERKKEVNKARQVKLFDTEAPIVASLSLELAKILLTSQGKINFAIAPVAVKLLGNTVTSLETEYCKALTILQKNPKMQEMLSGIARPQEQSIALPLIRMTLGIPPSEVVTQQETRYAVLGAFLHPSKRFQHPLFKRKFIQDISRLITVGSILDKGREKVPPIATSHSILSMTMRIHQDGKLESHRVVVVEVPEIRAALRQFNLTNSQTKKILSKWIEGLFFDSHEESIETTPRALIKGFSSLLPSLNWGDRRDCKNLAYAALDSLYYPPLLEVWETYMQSCMHDQDAKQLRQRVQICIRTAFSRLLIMKEQGRFASIFFNRLAEVIKSKTHIQSQIGNGMKALALWEIKRGESTCSLKEIQNPIDFRNFIINSLKQMRSQFSGINEFERICGEFEKNHPTVLEQILRDYDFINFRNENPLKNWEELRHLPFRDYLECPMRGQLRSVKALLKYMIKQAATSKSFVLPYSGITLEFTHPSLMQMGGQKKKLKKIIFEALVNPGQQLANQALSLHDQKSILESISNAIVPNEYRVFFLKEAKAFCLESTTICSFYYQVKDLLTHYLKDSDAYEQAELTKQLFKTVPAQIKNKMKHQAVVLASFTAHSQKKYFVVFYSPISQKLELGWQGENREEINPLNQQEWSLFFLIPLKKVKQQPSHTHLVYSG